jgi:hypothetical protein
VRDLPRRLREQRNMPGDVGRAFDLGVRRERADAHRVAVDLDAAETRHAGDVDEHAR